MGFYCIRLDDGSRRKRTCRACALDGKPGSFPERSTACRFNDQAWQPRDSFVDVCAGLTLQWNLCSK